MSYTFGAADIIAALGLTAADWEVQDSDNNVQQDYALTNSKDGQAVAASETAYNKREEKTLNLTAKNPAGSAVAFNLGGAGEGEVVITQFQAKESYNENATLSVTAHKHLDIESGAVHMATPVSQLVELSLGFGVSAVRLGGTLKDCQTAELSGQVDHTDRLSNKGKFLVGASHGLRFEATEEYVDAGAAVTVPAPWKEDAQDVKTVNNNMHTRTVRGHAYALSA